VTWSKAVKAAVKAVEKDVFFLMTKLTKCEYDLDEYLSPFLISLIFENVIDICEYDIIYHNMTFCHQKKPKKCESTLVNIRYIWVTKIHMDFQHSSGASAGLAHHGKTRTISSDLDLQTET
jgi:hypothetical protein